MDLLGTKEIFKACHGKGGYSRIEKVCHLSIYAPHIWEILDIRLQIEKQEKKQ